MDIDTPVPQGVTETDVCIIGAGPAGLVVAAELAARGRDVLLLESGATTADAIARGLNDGDSVGDAYAGTIATRHRQVGGTARVWNTPVAPGLEGGAKYAPLDAVDVEPRWAGAPDGWPIAYDELLPWYHRAQQRCGLGAFAYDATTCSARGVTVPAALESGSLVPRSYRLGSGDALLQPLLASLRRCATARLYTRATATELSVSRAHATVSASRPDGSPLRVVARRVVLAAGAIENARLLLVATAMARGIVDRSGWLGCGFMEHPRDRSMVLVPADKAGYRELAYFDRQVAEDGIPFAGRLGVREDVLRGDRALRAGGGITGIGGGDALLNASVTLLPIVQPARERARALLRRARVAPLASRWFPPGGHGWSAHPTPSGVYDGLLVLLNLEQPPQRENAVKLGMRHDRYGVPLPVLTWRWSDEDQQRLMRLRTLVRRELEAAGLGRVRVLHDGVPDPNAHHHAGTTRMHHHPAHGVVDAVGRVHGTENVFVAGASVFPTAGFANPTLTIVAMALRLAEELA